MTGLIVVLLAIGFLLVIAEAFVPGGVIGVFGVIALAVGIVLSFREYGATQGAVIFAATATGVFLSVLAVLRAFPRTRLGRRVLLSQKVNGTLWTGAAERERRNLVGKEGKALTDLRPAGKGSIEGKRWDVVTEGSYINRGESFRVLRVEGLRIVVGRKNQQ